jgi:phage-related protein
MANLPYNTRALFWVGDSKECISEFPNDVKQALGFALRLVQNGETPDIAAPLPLYGTGVYELRASGADNTYRVVYLLKLRRGVYVIDAFVKKSKRGKQIPKEIKARIESRLKYAREKG